MSTWIWLIAGVVLANLELLIPSSFFLLFLGLGAIVVGAVMQLGLLASWEAQVATFSVVSLLSWVLVGRRAAIRPQKKQHGSEDVIGNIIRVSQEIAPGATGSGELWGTVWRVKNIGESSIGAGAEAKIVASEGITLLVKAL